jgi:hypothetical protein
MGNFNFGHALTLLLTYEKFEGNISISWWYIIAVPFVIAMIIVLLAKVEKNRRYGY